MARNVFSSPMMEDSNGYRYKDGCRLYVKMTSHLFDEDKLREVFCEHGRVLDVFVSDKNWAFVTFEDKRVAQRAIATINRSNMPLQVSIAHESSRKSNRHSDIELLGCSNLRNVGRGHILNDPHFDGRHRPGMFEEAVFQDDLDDIYFTNIQCTVDERGKRISKGMGYTSNESDRRSSGRGPLRNDTDLQFQHNTKGDVCKHCDRPAFKECGLCAMPYCSRRCQLEDYNRHKLECTIPPLVDRKTTQPEEISKDDRNVNKSHKVKNKDASSRSSEKDNKRNSDQEVVSKNGYQGWSDHSTENSTQYRNHKSKQEAQQDFRQSQKDGSKKTNLERLRNQNENEAARNGRDKGILSSSSFKHKDQKAGNSMAARAEIKDLEATRQSVSDTEVKEKRKLSTDRLAEGSPSAADFKHQHQEFENSVATRTKVKDFETRESVAEVNENKMLPPDRFTEVLIAVAEGPATYWVQSLEAQQTLLDVEGVVSAVGANAKESYKPKVGELCVASYHGDWFRAKVTSLKPKLKVLFIDYGNEDVCSPADIKKLPESCKNIPPLAFRIKLIPETSKKYLNLATYERLKVKPLYGIKHENAVVVCVEDEPESESEEKCLYAIQKLKEGEEGTGKVVTPVSDEDTLVKILTERLKRDFLEVMHLAEVVPHLPEDDFKPKIGDLVAAEVEEEGLLNDRWGRAIILAVCNNSYLVHFVDHCFVLRAKNIRKLPRELADIPEFGAKLTILEYKKPVNGNWTQFFKTEGRFPFVVEEVNRNKNVTIVIKKGEEKVCRAILSHWNPVSDSNLVYLKDGAEVIIDFFDRESFYLRPVSASYTQMFIDLEEDLWKHCETVSHLSSIPPLKSLVACKFSHTSDYYRAQVIEVCKDIIKVHFVDYGNEDTVKLESLKPLSDDLKLYPFMTKKFPMRYLTERELTTEGTNLLLELSQEKTKLKMKLSNEVPSGIELVMEDGTTLNKKLRSFLVQKGKREFIHAPKKKETAGREQKSESSPATLPAAEPKSKSSADEIYRMDVHLKYEGLPIGKTVELLMLNKFSETHFACCDKNSPALKVCNQVLCTEVSDHCNTCEEHYRPREIGELCLAKFEEDGLWYRAMCLENTDVQAQKVKVMYIDYGNVDDVSISDIRKILPEFLETPAVAHLCTLKGSEQMSEEEKNVVNRLVKLGTCYEANIIEKKGSSTYVIEMLHITKAHSSELD